MIYFICIKTLIFSKIKHSSILNNPPPHTHTNTESIYSIPLKRAKYTIWINNIFFLLSKLTNLLVGKGNLTGQLSTCYIFNQLREVRVSQIAHGKRGLSFGDYI